MPEEQEEQKSYRIQTPSGHRKYLVGGKARPSVTTILSQTETEKSKKALQQWLKNNPNNDAAHRGTLVHKCCENYIRGLPIEIPDEYRPFWEGLSQYLDWIDEVHWSESPLRRDWLHCRSADRQFASVWSTEHDYAGAPDLVCEIGGVKVIADFKTSNGPYRTSFPERGDRLGFGGFRKYQKVSQQLAAYRLALEERTGYRCDCGLVLVSTETDTQAIFIDGDQMDLAEAKFIKRAQLYHQMFPDE